MEKSPEAFRTISEVADWLGVPTHVLRFWESRFSQVKPVKRAGGRRYYRPADMALLGGIKKLLHDDGLTIRGVQKVLREQGVRHVASLAPRIDDPAKVDEGVTLPGEAAPTVEEPGPGTAGAGETSAAERVPDGFAGDGAASPDEAGPSDDPDASLMRFPFVDEPEPKPEPPFDSREEPEEAPKPGAAGPEPAETDSPTAPAATAFVAEVPEDDPADDAPEFRAPIALPSFISPDMALRLKGKLDELAAIEVRAVALRNRMRDNLSSRPDR